MAGYRRKPKIYTLKWADDHELHGLVVSMRGMSVAKMLDLTEKASALTDKDAEGAERSDKADSMFRDFASFLVEWNLEEEDGTPVPATYDGIVAQDIEFILELVTSWMEAVASVGSPLPQASSNGSSALEASLPTEALSASP